MTTSSLTIGRQTLAALRIFLVLTVLVGVLYPAAVWAVGRVAFHDQATGSPVSVDGRVVGSSLLGQQWKGPEWFHGRDSASAYAGDASGGSNLPATDTRQQEAVAAREKALAPLGGTPPPDALTMSASGLDPHISPAYARLQAPAVARARGLQPAQALRLVDEATEGRVAGFLGDERVNVLRLNLALQQLSGTK
ncbi:potassium-transporting ATPase subunit KdpC [Flexivirga sp. ID2601S]|uniref:Potassium-transporting ATPase KdpC subunit n=1 Tax=Flexivirga aerilata TaxID=1656889 RepID=A0A849AJM1_9MICO|nr:potassium-transporting ATPase subunit KdpC [Flexivirga aerilata]NNG39521.1 potassium-transporting ATPase subunit KdpC [Flexivirga aerilata]